MSAMTGKPITGRRVLAWMIAFFGVVMVVNGVFVYLALDSWPGLSTPRAYEEGIAYNDTLADAARQRGLGWRSRADFGAPTPKGRLVSVFLTDGAGRPLSGRLVKGELARPVGEGARIPVDFVEETPGIYAALVRVPAAGRWRLDLSVGEAGADSVHYRMTHELWTEGTRP